jgi:hypothetical protein
MIRIHRFRLPAMALALGLLGADRSEGQTAPSQPLEEATVSFETNATDGDFEVVFEAKGGDVGLAQLTVVAPDGRTVLDMTCPPPAGLGMRSFRFESPEPPDAAAVRKAFPAGSYTFSGKTVDGKALAGKATLAHALPATTTLVAPAPESEDVPAGALEIRWKPVPGIAGYFLEVEQADANTSLAVNLPETATSFTVPEGYLTPGHEYSLGIGTRSVDGNLTVVETSFTTAK